MRQPLLNNSEADEAIAGIKKLTAILDKHPNKLTEFDEQLFDEMVEQITTDSSNIIRFMLIGGLKLNEKIERKTR